jgi:hypothetical protein
LLAVMQGEKKCGVSCCYTLYFRRHQSDLLHHDGSDG